MIFYCINTILEQCSTVQPKLPVVADSSEAIPDKDPPSPARYGDKMTCMRVHPAADADIVPELSVDTPTMCRCSQSEPSVWSLSESSTANTCCLALRAALDNTELEGVAWVVEVRTNGFSTVSRFV